MTDKTKAKDKTEAKAKDTKETKQSLSPSSSYSVGITGVALIAVAATITFFTFGVDGQGRHSGPETIEPAIGASGDNAANANPLSFSPEDVRPGDPVVAVVDGFEIKRTDVYQYVKTLPVNIRQLPPQAVYPLALDQVINGQIIQNKANQASLEKDPEVLEQVNRAKEQIVRSVYIQRKVEEQIQDKQVQAAYKDYVASLEEVEERKARHILVDEESQAKEIIQELNKGEDFAALAKEHSTGPTGANGGDLGWFTKDAMVPEFSEAAFSMKKGDVSSAPVKTEFGWHVVQLDDVRQKPKPTFEELESYLVVQLRQEKLEELVSNWRNTASIERFDINGEPLNAAAADAASATQ